MTCHRIVDDMSSESEYAPSTMPFVRDMVETIEKAGTTAVVDHGKGVVLLTMRGAKSGKIRKVPLMLVEREGRYAVVASLGGAPKHPVWYFNLKAEPKLQLQDGEVTREYVARELEVGCVASLAPRPQRSRRQPYLAHRSRAAELDGADDRAVAIDAPRSARAIETIE